MSDDLALIVGGRRLEKFLSYRVEADLYCADSLFGLEMSPLDAAAVDPGQTCQLSVNGQLVLTGIIDRVVDGDDKRGSRLTVEGRSLMGLLVDAYVEEFPDLVSISLRELAEGLLATVPFINRRAVRYQDGLAGATALATREQAGGSLFNLGEEKKNTHVTPGQTVFEVLRMAAASRGAIFYGLPDGTFVFGRPKAAGRPAFAIVHRRDGRGNTCLRSQRVRDISRRWSKITVLGQQPDDDLFASPEEINVQATLTDDAMPFYKPYVVVAEDSDPVSPAEQARLLLEMQRREGFQLVYSVRGHSQGGRNWAVNELCRVQDVRRGIDGVYLIYSRACELSKEDGRFTEVRLGLPGVA
jgi:prophage tail gpP-like protein